MGMRTVWLLFIILALNDIVFAVGKPENVLVVQNINSQVSMNIASYYMSKRNIPSTNLCSISTIDSSQSTANERISPADYTSQIENPIRNFLTSRGLTNTIQYIVLTKGIPHRLTVDPTGGLYGGQSVDSMLAFMDYVNPLQIDFVNDNGQVVATAYANRYWNAKEPFSHAKYGGYLVTRLDGYTEADAKAIVDRSIAPQPPVLPILLDEDPTKGLGNPSLQPKSLLLPDGSFNNDFDLTYADYNADMAKAFQVISGRPHVSATLDQTNTFMSSPNPLSGYISWGSNDGHFNSTVYQSLTFTNRSIVETAVSTSGRTFLPTTGGQSLIVDLLAHGAAGAKGYATEPFLIAVASPTVLLDLWTSGRNLAESYYAASRLIGWKDVVIGDPLCSLTGSTVPIAAAKELPDNTLVSIPNGIVSAGTDAFSDCFYIQNSERTSGIQVRLDTKYEGITEGMTVSVRGILATINGERVIKNASIIY